MELLSLVSFLLISCEDLLDVTNPNSITTGDFWQTETDALYSVNATYASLNGQPAGLRTRDCFSRTDEATSYYAWSEAASFYRNDIATGSGYDEMFNAWPFSAAYGAIYGANQAIAYIPGIEMDEDLKRRYISEVKFIKAFHFFNLTSLWGNVPFADTLKGDQTLGYASASIEDLWGLMEKELRYAQNGLPVQYDDDLDVGRITKGAATALLARVYMQQHKWDEARVELDKIVNGAEFSGVYGLVADYHDNFTDINENNEESLFEVQWISGPSASGSMDHTTPVSRVYSPVGYSQMEATVGIIKEFELSATYYNNGDPDPRRDVSFIWSGMDTTILVYGVTFDSLITHPNFTYSETDYKEHQWIRKYLDDYHKNSEDDWSGINDRKIRYADVLLMYAECLNNTGSTADAYQYINMVRDRSGIDPLTPSNLLADVAQTELTEHGFTIPSDDQGKMQLQIEYERIWELTGESIRWFDLVRWGYLESQDKIDILRYTDPDFDDFIVGRNHLLPFPYMEVDNNPELEQNFGY